MSLDVFSRDTVTRIWKEMIDKKYINYFRLRICPSHCSCKTSMAKTHWSTQPQVGPAVPSCVVYQNPNHDGYLRCNNNSIKYIKGCRWKIKISAIVRTFLKNNCIILAISTELLKIWHDCHLPSIVQLPYHERILNFVYLKYVSFLLWPC
jgi:hypothetical protein